MAEINIDPTIEIARMQKSLLSRIEALETKMKQAGLMQ
jgi:hypothetical protein